MKRLTLTVTLASLALLATGGAARATVTIGSNLANPPADNMPGCGTAGITCTATNLALPATSQAPGGLTSPVTGDIVSWRASAGVGDNLSLRILRPVGGATYTGVGRSGPVSFPGPGLSPIFPTSLPIERGDAIGLDSPNGNLILATTGATMAYWSVPPLFDGITRAASGAGNFREVLVQATIEPENQLEFGKLKRNKKKGIAKLTIDVPNPGELTFSGKKVKVSGNRVRSKGSARAARSITAAGEITVKVRAKGKKKRNLRRKGKVKVMPVFSFTPANGTTSTQKHKLKLRRKTR